MHGAMSHTHPSPARTVSVYAFPAVAKDSTARVSSFSLALLSGLLLGKMIAKDRGAGGGRAGVDPTGAACALDLHETSESVNRQAQAAAFHQHSRH
jgi:hypothetical protein